MTTATEPTTATITLKARTLRAIIEQCLVARGDMTRPALMGVNFTLKGGKLEACAADGFRLVLITADVEASGDETALLDGAGLKALLPSLRGKAIADTSVTIAFDSEGAGFTIGNATVTVPAIDGTFPNFHQLIPPCDKPGGDHAAFNGGLIGEVMAVAAKYAGSGIVRLRLQSPSAPARLDWKHEPDGWTGIGVVMPMFVDW